MIEGEGPDILQQLSADIPSVEAHEQQERRAFQIREVARVLQIPDDSVEANATVARYVTVLRDAQAGWERLRGSRTKDVLEGEPLLQERTGQAAALYHAEQVILEEGFGYGVVPEVRPIHLDPSRGTSLTSLLDRAAEPV